MESPIVGAAHAIWSDRYQDADAVFAAGSIIRGEGSAHSDLDLVVVHARLANAYRESFRFDQYPVEAFVHDRETLEYFFEEDRASGLPALPHMVAEGIEIPAANDTSRALKGRATALIMGGPPSLDAEGERRRRYAISDLLDDLRDVRPHDELVGIGTQLYEQLADYCLRCRGSWSAKGKAIARELRRSAPELCAIYGRSFDSLFQRDDAHDVIQLAEEILRARGGPLFEGYRADAPPTWRKPSRTTGG
jgi:hypothetical protein